MEPPNVRTLLRPMATDVPVIEKPPGSSLVTEEAEEEDSFFELEISAPDSDMNKCSTSATSTVETTECNANVRDGNFEHDHTRERKDASAILEGIADSRCNCRTFPQRGTSASPGDKLFSKRKILPIEGLYWPQSPISLLKSAPKFRVFTFAQSKSTAAAEKAEAGEKQGKNRGTGLLTLKFKTKEIQPSFTRSGSSRKAADDTGGDRKCSFSSDDSGGSKRFSREVIQKYLRLLKPLYGKVSKKQGSAEAVAGELSVTATATTSPPKLAGSGKPLTGSRSKQLVKSRSASAGTLRLDSPARMDDSLVQLQDGIQSAILHCKRSLSASRDFSPLSRCDAGSADEEKTVDLRRFSMD